MLMKRKKDEEIETKIYSLGWLKFISNFILMSFSSFSKPHSMSSASESKRKGDFYVSCFDRINVSKHFFLDFRFSRRQNYKQPLNHLQLAHDLNMSKKKDWISTDIGHLHWLKNFISTPNIWLNTKATKATQHECTFETKSVSGHFILN